ncbi:MAG: hypothetical protein ACK4J2_07540 [Sulfurihydrogenibium azorense]|jgi:hypothetical protein|uniref:hypothetical protein n=1 Tax=Sulfurihydrogenibium azorense TaxID=309806 RepID=UPI00391BD178
MKRVFILSMVLFGSFISSCSIFMPYEEEHACKRGINTGLCGSVSDVYNYYDKGYTIKDAEKFIKDKSNVRMCDGIYSNFGGVCR